MRIIGGTWGGRVIRVPAGLPVRPTTEKAREALFNSLSSQLDLEGLSVLDLFCGSFSMSLEFASRGAQVKSVDMHPACIQFGKKLQVETQLSIECIKANVFKYLESENHSTFSIIFADPPYQHAELRNLPDLIFNHHWLKQNGVFILEHPAQFSFEDHLHFVKCKQYGQSAFSFFEPAP